MSETKEKLSTENYSCPNCGGKTAFDPKTQKLKCPYCFSEFEVSRESSTKERDLRDLLINAKVWNATEVVQCENCGSREVISKGEISTHCAFCGTTNIVKTQEIVGMTPHGICPFQIELNRAGSLATTWAKKRWYAPNAFKKSADAKALKGLYTPAFTFDCETETRYKGVLGRKKEEVTIRNGTRHTSSYMTFFDISGNYARKFDDLLVHSSPNIPNTMISKMEPFPTNAALDYDTKYLAGYTATTYAKDGEQTWKECKQKVSSIVRREILRKYTYDKVEKFEADTQYFNTKFKYLLLPVYVGHYTFKKKNYNFYVNGSTGKVAGKAPVSPWKVLLAVLGGLLVTGAIITLALLSEM